MTVYSCSEADRKLAEILDEANMKGEVRIVRDDGKEFLVRPVGTLSPLDVPGVDLDLSAEEIVRVVRDGRER